MAFKHEFDPEKGIVRITVDGPVTIEDVLRDVGRTFVNSPFPGCTSFLIDSSSTTYDFWFKDAEKLVQFLESNHPPVEGCKWAIVAPSDGNFGIARMFEGLSYKVGIETGVFRDETSARDWLAS